MKATDPRMRMAILGAALLDVLPDPGSFGVGTEYLQRRIGAEDEPLNIVWRALDRLSRRGLAERTETGICGGQRMWRLTKAGKAWEGTQEDLATPIPWRAAYHRR